MKRKSKVSRCTSQSGRESRHSTDGKDNAGRSTSCSQYCMIAILHISHLQMETTCSSEALVHIVYTIYTIVYT
jgi:hypothetical protein